MPESPSSREEGAGEAQNIGRKYAKIGALVIAAALLFLGWQFYGDQLQVENLVEQEGQLRLIFAEHPILCMAAAFLIYVAVTGLSLPGATALSLAYAWFFGFWKALLLISFASTLGATLAFLLSRFIGRESILQRHGHRLKRLNEALEREGAFYLFSLRLIPVIPFFVINVLMGLTPMRTKTFWWVSQLGMLPGTVVYVYAGSSVPSLEQIADQGIFTPQLIAAFLLLGIFPLAMKKIIGKIRPAAKRAKKE